MLALTPKNTAPPLPATLMRRPCLQLDLSRNNPALADLDVSDAVAFGDWIARQSAAAACAWAAGGYAEDRAIYAMSPLFGPADEERSVHLGVDFWLPAGTPVFAVHAGRLHSFSDNARFGDYGPTLILEHAGPARANPLFSLYGHLARSALQGLQPGQAIAAGQQIGVLGDPGENLGWSPHLHFQLINDIGDYCGDFPGVCARSAAPAWLARCPDPAELIQAWCPDLRRSR